MEDVLYSVEPYTGNIICHTGREGMRWGFTHDVANGLRKAAGKLDPSTGRYLYNAAQSLDNFNGYNNMMAKEARVNALTNRGNQYMKEQANKKAKEARVNALTNRGNQYMKEQANKKAKEARVNALTKKGRDIKRLKEQFASTPEGIRYNINNFNNNIKLKTTKMKDAVNNKLKSIGDTITKQYDNFRFGLKNKYDEKEKQRKSIKKMIGVE